MARARSPNRDKAFEIYKDRDGNITNREIADMLDENEKTISNWKCRDKWNVVLQKNECSTTNKKVQKNTGKNIKKEPIAEDVKEVLENTELTDKQRLFCIYYIKYFNAAKAYQKAYKCSYESSLSNGYRLMENDSIKKEIEKLKQYKINRIMLSEEDIFQKYMDIAFSDIGDYLSFKKVRKNRWTKNDNGEDIPVINPDTGEQDFYEYNVVELNDSKELDTSILQEVSEGKDGVKIKLQDKMKALQWLSDHMNIATDKQKAELEVLKSRIVKDNSKNNTNSTAKLDSILGQIKERNKNE